MMDSQKQKQPAENEVFMPDGDYQHSDTSGPMAQMKETVQAVASRNGRPRPPKLYRIGEIVDYSGLSRQTIHNYTTMGLLRESRWSSGGHRLYDESVFERIDQISQFKSQNKSMEFMRGFFARMDMALPRPGLDAK